MKDKKKGKNSSLFTLCYSIGQKNMLLKINKFKTLEWLNYLTTAILLRNESSMASL